MLERLAKMLPRLVPAAPVAGASRPASPAAGTRSRTALDARIGIGPARGSARTRAASGLSNIQALRGLAAAMVLVHHAAIYAHLLRGADRPLPTFDTLMGLWGVSIFFAISGFLMAGLVVRDRPLVFLSHRISRIFPTYLAVAALFAALFAGLGLSVGGLTPLSLSLAPAGPRSYALNVEWTLVYETSFYVGLFLVACIGLARRITPLATLWLGLLTAAFLLLPEGSRDTVQPPLHLLPVTAACVPFAGGLLLPRLIAAGRFPPAAGLLALPVCAACFVVEKDVARWLGGVAAVLLVGATASGRQIREEGAVSRAVLGLGNASYVLYLVHAPMLVLTAWALPARWSGLAYGLTAVAASLGLAALLGPLDVALYRALRRRIDAASPTILKRGLALYLLLFVGCAVWGSVETARDDWRESRARAALAALPPETWTSRALATSAISNQGIALPASVQGALEGIERLSPIEAMVTAFAYDPAQPKRTFLLALHCSGRLIRLDRPRRARKDLAPRLGLENSGHRIGYRMPIPAEACEADSAPVAVVVDTKGRMAVLTATPAP
ncbi:acyltransferase family protein [Methylobacterium sp. ID0610]|uniref:acyltransferase family protein n=1 Tax=Methylobacterium carpenticola TaxID=3344827 RepID=UPI0036C1B14D